MAAGSSNAVSPQFALKVVKDKDAHLSLMHSNSVLKSYFDDVGIAPQEIMFDQLSDRIDGSQSFLCGIVEVVFPISHQGSKPIRKLVLTRRPPLNSPSHLVVFLKESAAESSSDIHVGGLMVLSGFVTELSPTSCITSRGTCLYCVNIMPSRVPCSAWFFSNPNVHAPLPSPRSSSTGQTSAIPERLSEVTYEYTLMENLKVNSVVNVYGVVRFFKAPFRTSTGEHCCVMTLVDHSLPSLEQGLSCVLFSKDLLGTPHIRSVGDVVRLHRIRITMFGNDLQAQKGPGFSWLLFPAKADPVVAPYASSSVNYTLTEMEKNTVQELQAWASSSPAIQAMPPMVDVSLSSIKPDSVGQRLCALVVAVCLYSEASQAVVVLSDGTQTPYPSHMRRPLSEASSCNFSWKLLQQASTYLAFVYMEGYHSTRAQSIHPGSAVTLTGLSCRLIETDGAPTTVELVLSGGTSYGRGLQVLADDDTLSVKVRQLVDAMETQHVSRTCGGVRLGDLILTASAADRALSEPSAQLCRPCPLFAGSLTLSDFSVPVYPLSEVKECEECPYYFRCCAQLLAVSPLRADQSIHVGCSGCGRVISDLAAEDLRGLHELPTCVDCGRQSPWRVRLEMSWILVDRQSQVTLLTHVGHDEMLDLFQIGNSSVLLQSEIALAKYHEGYNRLKCACLLNEAMSEPGDTIAKPSLDCCIKLDWTDAGGKTFHIFGTRLK